MPIETVAKDRSEHYWETIEETRSFFEDYPDEAIDWLENNMNPEDFLNESYYEPLDVDERDDRNDAEKKVNDYADEFFENNWLVKFD